ncbi:MAG: ComF family protein [Candidatus Firestonebacteria bacterium]
MEKVKNIIIGILDIIFPANCKICSDKLDKDRKGSICGGCWGKIKIIKHPMCVYCGKQLTSSDENFCADCTRQRFSFVDNRSVGIYEGVLKEGIHLLKYKGCRVLAKHFGELMVEFIKENCGVDDIDCIIPVPMYKKKQSGRDYNQAELLSKCLADYFKIPLFTDVLIRVKETIPQHKLSKEDRFLNVKGVFEIRNPGKIKWACVLLVDDILTTGATADECSSMLLGDGASQIRVFTLARGM